MSFFKSSGILAKLPGDVVGGTERRFPKAGPGQPAERHAEIDHALGRVRITYKLASSRHNKCTTWYWQATFAEVISVAEPATKSGP